MVVTDRGLALAVQKQYSESMFDKAKFLADVLAKAGTQAAIARALEQPTSRIAELYTGKRRLTMEDGMKLSEAFGVAPTVAASGAVLTAILKVCLRHPPKDGWTDQACEHLAQEIEYGLQLLRSATSSQPSQDALDVASRAIADRLRQKLS